MVVVDGVENENTHSVVVVVIDVDYTDSVVVVLDIVEF